MWYFLGEKAVMWYFLEKTMIWYLLKDHFPSYVDFLYGLTQEEHQKLEESTVPFHECVVRIIRVNKQREVAAVDTAFRVYNGNRRSLFLTCDHNFGKIKRGEVIRLYDRDDKNYPVAKILARSHHEKHDLLLFSVESVPEVKCLEFSTDEVFGKD